MDYGPLDDMVLISKVLGQALTKIDVLNLVVRCSLHKSLAGNIIFNFEMDHYLCLEFIRI